MKAEIIAVGTEILLGQIVNTNAAYLSKKMAELGIDVYYHTTVGDNPVRLVSTIEEALLRSDIVFTMGGLGPTVDDITLYAIGSATSRALVANKAIEKYITHFFKKRGIKKIPKDAFKQAYIPRGAIWFENKVGTAPAVLVEHGKSLLIALPGPPRELIPIIEKDIIPYLKKKRVVGKEIIKTKALKVAGCVEAGVNEKVKDLLAIGPKTTVGIYAHLDEVDLKISSKAKSEDIAFRRIRKVEKEIKRRLGNYLYGVDNESLESVTGDLLRKNKRTLAIAESCTGGLIANRITNISGSSDYFKTGIVAYSNKAKVSILGVLPEKLNKYGAVSKGVALDMADGVRNLSKADLGLAVTGIAGPKGGTKNKPVGLVYIAVSSDKIKMVKEFRFAGSRADIKHQTSTAALNLLRCALL